MQTDFVGKLELENNETVWVVHRVIDVPAFNLPSGGNPTLFNSGRNIDLADGNFRAILFGSAEDGSRFMVDCAVEAATNATEQTDEREPE